MDRLKVSKGMRYWRRRVWTDYAKRLGAVAILGAILGGIVSYYLN